MIPPWVLGSVQKIGDWLIAMLPSGPKLKLEIREVCFVYRLLWVAIPLLVATVFPETKFYIAIAAAVLAIDVLWRAWATRKVGRVS